MIEDNNKVTIKIRDGVKWSDGEPLKIEDLIQPYLIIGHQDYAGVRYDSDFQNIVGAVEYHDGKADTISGLKKVDETTLEISFNKIISSNLLRWRWTMGLCCTKSYRKRYSNCRFT